jgi:hypothetical protein
MAAKVALAVVTCLLLVSAGGGILLVPALVPLHVWAARCSSPAGRALWSLPGGLGLGAAAWAGVYTAMGERQPLIWAVPIAVAAASSAALWRVASR